MTPRKFVVAVYDSAVQAYAQPILVPAKGVAVRSFSDEVNRAHESNTLYSHPEDFELRLLCMFDEATGSFVQLPDGVPETLARGKDVKSS